MTSASLRSVVVFNLAADVSWTSVCVCPSALPVSVCRTSSAFVHAFNFDVVGRQTDLLSSIDLHGQVWQRQSPTTLCSSRSSPQARLSVVIRTVGAFAIVHGCQSFRLALLVLISGFTDLDDRWPWSRRSPQATGPRCKLATGLALALRAAVHAILAAPADDRRPRCCVLEHDLYGLAHTVSDLHGIHFRAIVLEDGSGKHVCGRCTVSGDNLARHRLDEPRATRSLSGTSRRLCLPSPPLGVASVVDLGLGLAQHAIWAHRGCHSCGFG